MTDLPSMPLYVVDFDGDTGHLSLEEDGAYNRLLRLCWKTPGCSVPDDPDWIARKMRVDRETFDRVVAPLIAEFFTRKSRRIWQKRQREEYTYVTNLVAERRSAGSKGGKAKSLKNKETADSKARDLQEAKDGKALAPTPTPTPTVKEGGGGSAPDTLHEDVLVAAKVDVQRDAFGKWYSSTSIHTVQSWREDLGLSDAEIVNEISRVVRGRGPPSTLSYFTPAMQRVAGLKSSQKLVPIEPTRGASNAERTDDAWKAAAARIAQQPF